MISVEVAYAKPDCQRLMALEVPEGTTVEGAIALSGILTLFPEIDLIHQKVGIFSRPVLLTAVLKNSDRVEIYRPLLMSPMDARRRRARKSRSLAGPT